MEDINMADTYFTPSDTAIVHETSVDFVVRGVSQVVHLVQYNKGDIIAVKLYNNGVEYAVPNSNSVRLRFGKKDHTFVIQEAKGYSEDRTIVYFDVDKQMTVLSGNVEPNVEITNSNSIVICASPIPVLIDRNSVQDGDVKSTYEYADLVDKLAQATAAAKEATEAVWFVINRYDE